MAIEKYTNYLQHLRVGILRKLKTLHKIKDDKSAKRLIEGSMWELEQIGRKERLMEVENTRLSLQGMFNLVDEFKDRVELQFTMLHKKLRYINKKLQKDYSSEKPYNAGGVSTYYCSLKKEGENIILAFSESGSIHYVIRIEGFEVKIYTNFGILKESDNLSLTERLLNLESNVQMKLLIDNNIIGNTVNDRFALGRFLDAYETICTLFDNLKENN